MLGNQLSIRTAEEYYRILICMLLASGSSHNVLSSLKPQISSQKQHPRRQGLDDLSTLRIELPGEPELYTIKRLVVL